MKNDIIILQYTPSFDLRYAMKYIEYREKREHGTREFPYACYMVTENFPRYNMVPHWHNECEIIYVRRGTFELFLNGRTHRIDEGCCSLIIGGSVHGGTPLKDCRYDCLVFDMATLLKASQISAIQLQPILNHEKQFVTVFPVDSKPSQYALEAIEAMLRKPVSYELIVPGTLLCMLASIVSDDELFSVADGAASDIKKARRFKQVISYIEQHYRENITLEEMAQQCGMNRNYFCRAFKEYTRKTPVEYLNYYRIESACELIVSTDQKLIDIALNCGFNDYSYFIKVFKSLKGVTPRDYCRRSF